MPIRIPCSCGVTLQVADNLAGKLVACGKCKARHTVPSAQTIAPPARPAPPPLPQRPAPPPLPVFDDPPAEPRLHYPKKDPKNADFVVPAPREIGAVLTAHTSLLKSKRPMSMAVRILIAMIIVVVICGAPVVAIATDKSINFEGALVVFAMIGVIVTPFSIGLTLWITRFRHYNAYTGEQGVAQFNISGSRDNVKPAGLFLFRDADYLRVTIVNNYMNGIYSGTTFDYDWTDNEDRRIFRLKGTHGHAFKTPPLHSKHLLALAAEEAWSAYLLNLILHEIREGRSYTFALSGDNGICCHRDFVELHQKRKVQVFHPGDLAEVQIKDGVISLKEPDAQEGWFTSTGVHSFSFAELANAQVFLMLLHSQYGVPTF